MTTSVTTSRAGAGGRRARAAAIAVLALTVIQLAVATFVPGLPQFDGKAFGARLVFYPAMMLVVPAAWWLARRSRGSWGHLPHSVGGPPPLAGAAPLPWAGFGFLMLPFLIDVTGNTLDAYDRLWWWDDANHLVNWFLLGLGAGLLISRGGVRPAWALGLVVAGLGAVLAIGWELGEYVTFIRHGTELGTAYTDTLGDELLGTLGAALAGVLVAVRSRRTR